MIPLTLEEAQRWYGYLVPWVLDNRDLRVIRRHRTVTGSSPTQSLVDSLWKTAKK